MGYDKGLDGKSVGRHGIAIGSVVANDRPVITEADKGFLCGDGSGGLVYKTSSGTSTLTNSGAAINVTDSTDSSSSVTGALKTAGGLGVAKAANIGTNLAVAGATDASSSTTGSLKTAGGLGVAKKAFVGTGVFSPKFKDATDASGLAVGATTANIVAAGTTVVKTASDAFGVFSATTPVAQQSTTGTTTGFTAGSGTAAKDDSTYTGNVGSKAYTVGDIVKALKAYGLLASS